jgi:Protein of unknown function (DUF1592)/Protein of unknown function (DUF1588)/Protein of unknown function (DUF1595)/Protein of unknown function (DUF1587)/Protein of unknown function (DUF1585)
MQSTHSRLRGLGASALFFIGACSGTVGEGDGEPGGGGGGSGGTGSTDGLTDPDALLKSAQCKQPNPGAAPMRRLSNAEYGNVVGDLLKLPTDASRIANAFLQETESLGFRNQAELLAVQSVVADQYMKAAEELSAKIATNAAQFANCTGLAAPACGSKFIQDFGMRAFRRPLTAEEKTRYQASFDKAVASFDLSAGIEWTVNAMLQSPNFLYRPEFGDGKPTSYEMASRLSFLFWQSMPDDELFAAAAADKLQTSAQVRAQAERLLADPRSDRSIEFYRQWLDTDKLPGLKRDAKVFPNLPSDMTTLFAKETDAFARDLVFGAEGTFEELMAAPYTYVNDALAKHYGIPGTFGPDFKRVPTDFSAGILTQAGYLTVHDKPTRTSIVLRGVKLRTDVMCQLVPAPPNDVSLNLEALGSDLTQKERLALHRKEPACSSCHELIDPLGLSFENFDAVGRIRANDELGRPIDLASEITLSTDVDGAVNGPKDIGARFAKSDQIRDCYLTQNFRFFFGRDFNDDDNCSLARISKAFRDSGYNLKNMLLAMTEADTFLYHGLAQ